MKRVLQFAVAVVAVALCAVLVWLSIVLTAPTSGSSAESETMATPSVTQATENFAESALNYTRQHIHILSGQPRVISSQRVTYGELNALGLSVGNYGSSCTQPQQLVILQGDFDMRGAVPMSLAPSVSVPASYVAYVYDVQSGDQVSIQWDRDGSHFKRALRDPSLPDPNDQASETGYSGTPSADYAPSAPAPVSPYLSCVYHVAPGWATPPANP